MHAPRWTCDVEHDLLVGTTQTGCPPAHQRRSRELSPRHRDRCVDRHHRLVDSRRSRHSLVDGRPPSVIGGDLNGALRQHSSRKGLGLGQRSSRSGVITSEMGPEMSYQPLIAASDVMGRSPAIASSVPAVSDCENSCQQFACAGCRLGLHVKVDGQRIHLFGHFVSLVLGCCIQALDHPNPLRPAGVDIPISSREQAVSLSSSLLPDPQVRASVIQPVSVHMVDRHRGGWPHEQVVHVDEASVDGRTRVPSPMSGRRPVGLPTVCTHRVSILQVRERDQRMGQRRWPPGAPRTRRAGLFLAVVVSSVISGFTPP